MLFMTSLRDLFRTPKHRRRPLQPRIVEILEERVLLTNEVQFDVAFFDVLKGQNFVQTSANNPVLQAGSPFHLHSSVHSPTGFTSSATLQRPVGSIKTLTQNGPPGHLSLEESFATKTALDTAYGSGNYTTTVMHPLSVEFTPQLDVSAALGHTDGSDTFASQSAAPNSSGVFHEVWSPLTPAIDVDGTVTATQFSAAIKGHTNASLTGSISATWNGTAYVGTYNFNNQSGSVTIPEGIAATLNLPSDAYPNAPHITDFTAAQSLNPAADFTLTWDAFAGGTADDLVTLFVFDGNNQVFNTNPIPLPSNSPTINGTATSFVLPKNTLQANKTYNSQLWFTNYTTLDTTSFPGAKGATGYYIATNFTIKTGAAVDNSPADVAAYFVAKTQDFVQTSAAIPTLDPNTPFAFGAFVEERDTDGATVNSSTVTLPTNLVLTGSQALQSDGGNEWDFLREFNTKTDLDAAFKAGKYTFSINTANQGLKSPAVTLPADAYPVTPHISNWTDAQLIDASNPFTVNWDTFTGGTTDDFIQLTLVDHSGVTVFETPDFWRANPLTGTARSVAIPAGTLIAGENYNAQLLFANASMLDRTTYKNSLGTTAYTKRTAFSLQTIPPGGILQFQTTGFSVNENAIPAIATITVTRTGGSTGEVKIDYATSNGSATAGSDSNSDYTGVTGTLTFADGVTSQTFDIPIFDDTISEGHETAALQLTNPTNGALLGTRATSTLTILDNELTFGPGSFTDSDGDKYTISLTGPGQARIALDDPDGDGKGSIAAILLSNTTSTSSLTVFVTKATTGDGEVSIGRVTGTGSLSSFSAAKSDLIVNGFSFDGFVGQVIVDDVLNGADIVVGGVLANATKFTLGDVAAGTELRSGATVSALTAQSFLGDLIQAPAITALTVNAGSFPADLNVVNAVKTLTLKAGGASGDWFAASFGTVSITGGGFSGSLRSNATTSQLGTTPALSSLTITGGNLAGRINAEGLIGTLKVSKNSAAVGGTIQNATIAASGFSQITVGRDLVNSVVLAGARLGADLQLGGSGTDVDSFGAGTIKAVSVGGQVENTIIGAGLDPVDGVFGNENDLVIGGSLSSLGSISVVLDAGIDTYVRAGVLPATVKIANRTIDPKKDGRFLDLGLLTSAKFLKRSNPSVHAAEDFLNERIRQGSQTAVEETLDFLQANSSLQAEMAPEGNSIIISDHSGASRILLTDEADRDEWLVETLDSAIPRPQQLAASSRSAAVEAAPVAVKNDQVLLLFPHTFIGQSGLAAALKSEFAAAGKTVTTKFGPIDPDTMMSLGNYGVVFMMSHGGTGKTSAGNATNFISSGATPESIGVTPDALPQFVGSISNDSLGQLGFLTLRKNATQVEPDDLISYSSKFFGTVPNLDGTLILMDTCYTMNGDLSSTLTSKGATMIGWDGPFYFGLANQAFLSLAKSLARGNSAGEALDEVQSDATLRSFRGSLPHLLGHYATIDQLRLAGNANLKITPPPPVVSIRDVRQLEGNSGTTRFVFTVSLSSATSKEVRVNFATADGTATTIANADYGGLINTAVIAPRTTSTTIAIQVVGDMIDESDETFFVQLYDSVNAVIDPDHGRATGTIVDDDDANIIVSAISGPTTESGGTATFTIKLATKPTADVIINLSSDDPSEGTVTPASVKFTPAMWTDVKTITVKGVNDSLIDGDVVYRILTSVADSPDPNYRGKKPSDVTVTNRDNDQPTSLSGTFRGTWTRSVPFGSEVSQLTWVLTQSGSTVTGTFTNRIVSSPIDANVGTTQSGRLINGLISGSKLTIQFENGTRFTADPFTFLRISGVSGFGGASSGTFVLNRV